MVNVSAVNEDYVKFQNSIIKQTLWLTIVISLAALVLGHKTVTKGIILGGLFSVLDFKLMAMSLPKSLQSASKAKLTVNRLGRLLIMAIPLVAAYKFPAYLNFIAAAIGLFLVKVTIFLRYVVFKKTDSAPGR